VGTRFPDFFSQLFRLLPKMNDSYDFLLHLANTPLDGSSLLSTYNHLIPTLSNKNTHMATMAVASMATHYARDSQNMVVPAIAMYLIKSFRIKLAAMNPLVDVPFQVTTNTAIPIETFFPKHILEVTSACFYVACRSVFPRRRYTLAMICGILRVPRQRMGRCFRHIMTVLEVGRDPMQGGSIEYDGRSYALVSSPPRTAGSQRVDGGCGVDSTRDNWFDIDELDELDFGN
jgi:hypothetical protein